MVSFKVIEHAATADVLFQAFGKTLNTCFKNAALALESLTVSPLSSIHPSSEETMVLSADDKKSLLIAFLEELIFIKDTKHLVFSKMKVTIKETEEHWSLTATLNGEKINPKKHQLGNDIKAVTYHQFKLVKQKGVWMAQVLLDI